jgi:hypothetical protein
MGNCGGKIGEYRKSIQASGLSISSTRARRSSRAVFTGVGACFLVSDKKSIRYFPIACTGYTHHRLYATAASRLFLPSISNHRT